MSALDFIGNIVCYFNNADKTAIQNNKKKVAQNASAAGALGYFLR